MDHHIENACAAVVRDAMARGVGQELAESARTATVRAASRSPRVWTHRRVSAYFWAVVRRSSVRRRDGRRVAEHLVLEAVIEDLRSAGRGDEAIVRELEHGWRGRVSDEVYVAVTARLCA